jgi:threonine dehydrogenase-like Zn-dependent dehydrogenase
MRALVVTPGKPETLRLMEVPQPRRNKGEALLRIMRVGICATDRDIVFRGHGRVPEGSEYIILGHEAVGRVIEIDGIDGDVREGATVVPTVRRPCPEMCSSCSVGEEDYCITGNYREHGVWGLHGFASDYAVTDAKYLVGVPEKLKDEAVLLEPIAVVVKAIEQVMAIQKRFKWEPENALVLGTGSIGLLSILVLRLKNFEVTAFGRTSPEGLKAKLVEKVGARYTREVDDGEKFDIIVEATGSVEVAYKSLKLGKPNSILVLLGVYPQAKVTMDFGSLLTDFMQYNKVVVGSVTGNKRHFEMGKAYLEQAEKYPGFLKSMITKVVKPSDFLSAIERKAEDIKNIIDFTVS